MFYDSLEFSKNKVIMSFIPGSSKLIGKLHAKFYNSLIGTNIKTMYFQTDNKKLENITNISGNTTNQTIINDPNKSIMLIGDSMLEGVGVNYENTLPNLIKEKTGIQTINDAAIISFHGVKYSP